MAQKASPLVNNYSSGAPAPSSAAAYQGGRGVIISEATTYPTTCQVQTQSISGKWIPIGANIAADGTQAVDLPAGQYRVLMNGGTASAVYITLVSVAYL